MTATTDGSTGALPPRAASASDSPAPTLPRRPGRSRPETPPRAPCGAPPTSCSRARTPRAGGRATSRRTSPWTPRTCCSASSSASGTSRPPAAAGPASSAASSARTATWATFYGGPGELSATDRGVRRAAAGRGRPGRPAHGEGRPRGSAGAGGIAAARVFTRIWLALFGWWKWDDLPELPPELIYFPKWMPLNIYDFGCWARQTIVPLTVVVGASARCAPRPSRSTSCTPTRATPTRPGPSPAWPVGTASSSGSTRRCTCTAGSPRARCAGRR